MLSEFDGDPVPLRGRLLIAPDVHYLERAFDATKYGEMSPAPWLEISIPTMIDSSLAGRRPRDVDLRALRAETPAQRRRGPDSRTQLYRAVLRVLEPHMPSLSSLIVEREVLTPEDLETRGDSAAGTSSMASSALDQTWIARPLLGWAQYRTPIDRLFLASAGAIRAAASPACQVSSPPRPSIGY